jgi:hypothetical protein
MIAKATLDATFAALDIGAELLQIRPTSRTHIRPGLFEGR